LDTHTPNVFPVGRNGMHRYNNQDHSMLTALMAARNILGESFDLWQMHGDTEYLEEGLVLDDAEILKLESEGPPGNRQFKIPVGAE
jgi:hypothetical protein